MAWIAPNTEIILMRGVPFTPSYKHTMYFTSLAEQASYFQAFSNPIGELRFTAQTYQRVNKNTCRLEINAEKIYDCNYMSFKNSAFGNKTFYAFITNVEYINHNVSEITYELDEIQTWFFEMVLGQCYVEREHTTTDYVGDNLLAEPIEIGDHICESITPAGFSDMSIIMNVAFTDPLGGGGEE